MTLANIQPVARLVLSAGIVFGVMAAVAATSSALFSDTATINGSTFATGSVNLQIALPDGSGDAGTYGDTIQGANVNDMMPGETRTFEFWLKNDSNSDLDLTAIVNDITGSTDLRPDLSVEFTCDVANDTNSGNDGAGVPAKTLTAWEADTQPDPDLGTLTPDDLADSSGTDEAKCTMTATLDSNSTASSQSVTFDAQFTGTQS